MMSGSIGLSSKGMDPLISPNSQKSKKNSMNLGNKNALVIAELRKGKGLLGSVGGGLGGGLGGGGAITSPHGAGTAAGNVGGKAG